jgi:hypothetical protein
MAIAVGWAGMPAKAAVEARANAVLGTPGSATYRKAKGIVSRAADLTDAVVTDPFFLSPLSQAAKDEVVNMVGLIPGPVSTGVVADLQTAFAANARIVFVWNQHPTGGFDHSTATQGKVAFVELRTPPGD